MRGSRVCGPNIPGVIRGIQGVVDPAADGSFSIAPGAIENNIAGSNDQYIETAFSVIFSASNGNSTEFFTGLSSHPLILVSTD